MPKSITLGLAVLILITTPALAQSAPPPAADWVARTVSILAVLIALAAFIWGRFDKFAERKAAKAAKDPSVDLDISGFEGGRFDYELTIVNRADVSIALLSLSCNGCVKLLGEDADISRDRSSVDYNALRIERGTHVTVVGQIIPPPGGGTVEFVVRIRINEAVPRTYETRLKRTLRR
jgi:hypothetical protein